jgi:hypothetical protein
MNYDPRLLDEIGMIDDGGDTVGMTCQYAMVYDDIKLFNKIAFWLIQPYNYKNLKHVKYHFYRSKWHLDEEIKDQSRDHIFWYKITAKYFKIDDNNWYFRSLKPFGRISDKYRMTPDLWLFCRDLNFLWQLSLFFYLIPITLITKIIHWLFLPQTTPDKFKPKPRIHKYSDNGKIFYALKDKEIDLYYDDMGQIKTLKELLNVGVTTMQAGNWTFFEYLFADIWTWATYRPYTLYQTAWALHVSKNIFLISWILKRCLRWMSWRGNPIVYYLTK